MSIAPHAAATVSPKEGLMAWARGAERWLDARGRKAWFVVMILAFIFVWPLGLALLAYMIWSNRMFSRTCSKHNDRGSAWGRHGGQTWGGAGPWRSSGNAAFDAYKAETLKRLQEEQEAFEAFLQRLRDAKDKQEFDAFMNERARSASGQAAPSAETPRTGEY